LEAVILSSQKEGEFPLNNKSQKSVKRLFRIDEAAFVITQGGNGEKIEALTEAQTP
jgi:hypothetical protein